MDKCPHCGSTEPFKYKATLVTLRMGQWGEKVDEEVSVESSTFAKTVTCTECGRRVNFDLAHEKAVEQSFAADAPMWRCKACGSENSHQFANCVHCGASGRR